MKKEQIITDAKALIANAKELGKDDLPMQGFATKVERALMQHLQVSIDKEPVPTPKGFLSVDKPQEVDKIKKEKPKKEKLKDKESDENKSNDMFVKISKMTIPELMNEFKLNQMKVIVQAINEKDNADIEMAESNEQMAENIFKHFQKEK